SYPGRSYCGTPDYKCQHCGAIFWLRERVRSDSSVRDGRVVYNNCCKGGKVRIPPFRPRPQPLASLARYDGDARSNKFMKNIRQYNCLFAFTSMGAKIDRSMNDGRGPPVFKISGQVHHRIGSLLPSDGSPPKFIQLYIYDTANEVRNRLHALNPEERPCEPLDPKIVEGFAKMLDDHNPFAKQFRKARDRLAEHGDEDFVVRIVGAREGGPVQYNLPTTDQLAMLVVGDFTLDTFKRDIVIQARDGGLQQISTLHPYNLPTTDQLAMLVVGDFTLDTFKRDIVIQARDGGLQQISTLHPAFMALQYPLLFPFGEPGFQPDQPNPWLCYGALSSQAKVDARACIDENRLWYIIKNQKKTRLENMAGITDAVGRGCVDGSEIGKPTVLPASHTGGRRYMIQNYHDTIAICRVYGPPDFFVTFTCNPKWVEISEAIACEPGQKATDRADVVVRVYHMKLEELMQDVRDGTAFGPVIAVLHTVEFQKRGLPHAHIILWVAQDTSQPSPAFIDKFISAEIPDPDEDPLGYALVAEHMIHGPCGPGYETCPCMKNGKCSKKFPKAFQEETILDEGGFAVYKRPNNG
ncbi:hypothetical protein U9M48_040790, partial [Paspalum notatum var. saurae]